jgi:hypothetical protein
MLRQFILTAIFKLAHYQAVAFQVKNHDVSLEKKLLAGSWDSKSSSAAQRTKRNRGLPRHLDLQIPHTVSGHEKGRAPLMMAYNTCCISLSSRLRLLLSLPPHTHTQTSRNVFSGPYQLPPTTDVRVGSRDARAYPLQPPLHSRAKSARMRRRRLGERMRRRGLGRGRPRGVRRSLSS